MAKKTIQNYKDDLHLLNEAYQVKCVELAEEIEKAKEAKSLSGEILIRLNLAERKLQESKDSIFDVLKRMS